MLILKRHNNDSCKRFKVIYFIRKSYILLTKKTFFVYNRELLIRVQSVKNNIKSQLIRWREENILFKINYVIETPSMLENVL